ncbi:MAG: hypothetical protein Q7S64_03490 [bacterium]|nr:hypothetical protein [bacterium]
MNKFISSLFGKIKSVARKITTPVLAVSLLGAVTLGSVAVGSIKKAVATPTPQFNGHANDEPTIQIRKVGTTAWSNSVTLQQGEQAQVFMYVHNFIQDSAALNTKVRATVPTTAGTTQTITGSVWADNAVQVNGNVTVNLGSFGKVVADPNSVKHYINQNGSYVEQAIANPGNVLTAGGLNLGTINGCWQYLRAVTFTVTAVEQGTASITTYKEVGISNVDTVWHRDGVSTTPGNVAAFHLYLENTGPTGSSLDSPTITDTLDSHLTYKPNSSYMITRDAAGVDVRYDIPDSFIAFNGQTVTWAFSTMPAVPANAVHLYFQATLKDGSNFAVGTTRLFNRGTVNGRTNNNPVTATTNQVYIDVLKSPTPVIDFDINKVIKNITTNSLLQEDLIPGSPGDTIEYTIHLVNTGNVTANGRVRDILPQYVTRTGNVEMKSSSQTSASYATIDPQGMFTSTGYLTLPNVLPGNTNGFDIRYRVTVAQTGIPAGNTTLVNTAQIYSDTQLEDSDHADILLTSNTAYIVSKLVFDPTTSQWVESTNTELKEGDIIRYRVDVINTGNTQLLINTIRDVLPQYVTYIDNSLVMDPQISPTPITDDSTFFAAGLGNFQIYPGVTKRFEFQVKVVDCPIIGVSTLTNGAYLRANNDTAEVNDTATIKLRVVAPNGSNL